MNEENLRFWLIPFVVLVVCALWEAVLLGIAFFNADRVECNLLYCSFITERITQNSYCAVNGVEVNCSEFKKEFPDWNHYVLSDGSYQLNGVCPGWKDNKTVEDCFREMGIVSFHTNYTFCYH